jgi:hypothetical protein
MRVELIPLEARKESRITCFSIEPAKRPHINDLKKTTVCGTERALSPT